MAKTIVQTILLSCFAFLLLLLSPAHAQNWNPFPTGESFLYAFEQNGSTDTWLHGVKTDSIRTIGPDQVYFFNRINRYLENNEMVPGCSQQPLLLPETILLDRENYFGEKMLLHSNGEYEFVGGNAQSFTLQTQVPVGTVWNFAPAISASLDSIRQANFLNVTDSVMYISLSNGKQIHLSKQHGFVKTFSFFPL